MINKIKSLIKFAKQVNKMVDSGNYPIGQLSFLGQTQDVRQITPYGLYCHPPIDSEWLVLNLRGNSDDKVGIGNNYLNRFKNLKEGEFALYNQLTGSYIYFKENGDIELIGKNDLNATIDGSINVLVKQDADITVNGNLTGSVKGDADVVVESDATVDVQGSAALTVAATMDIDCPETTWEGDIIHNGLIVNTGDITSNSVSLDSHTHQDVQPGTGDSGPPNPGT
jgi:phage gp45-like